MQLTRDAILTNHSSSIVLLLISTLINFLSESSTEKSVKRLQERKQGHCYLIDKSGLPQNFIR